MTEIECTICDRNFTDWQYLAEHLGSEHRGFKPSGAARGIYCDNIADDCDDVSCWCGWSSSRRQGITQFAQHLKKKGGMRAHILETALR